MGYGLPQMVYGDGISKQQMTTFGGYNHNLYAGDGEIWDEMNMTGDEYPLLAPRAPRWLARTLEKPNGLYAKDGLYWVDGTGFYADGALRGIVTDGEKQFASLGAYIVILPDRKIYNTLTGEFGSLEAAWSGRAVLRDGTYVGEEAKANTIYAEGVDFSAWFRAGDALTISGAAGHEENNVTVVVREVDGSELRFYENSFVIADGGDTESALTVRRAVPEMDFICEHENRLWGCKGDELYASKLGDPYNWNVFDGVATDSYAVQVASAGDFTALVSFRGYVIAFKEEHICKVYGDKPSNFQVMSGANLGVAAGSHRSLAVAGETLYYLSRVGVCAYTGGIPQSIAAAFGNVRYRNAVGGSDGVKYYVSMADADGAYTLFVYDTRSGRWHKEDGTQAVAFGWKDELHMLDAGGGLWLCGNVRDVPEGASEEETVESMVEFGDFVEANPNKKGSTKLQMRVEVEAGSSLSIAMEFDSDGVWRHVAALVPHVKRSYYLPIIPRRSDHFRIRLQGRGKWRLYSLVRESYSGSEM